MILKQLAEARYAGSEPIDEFYALYDLDKKRFVKANNRTPRNIFQRARGIRSTDLFDTRDAAELELQRFKDRTEHGIEYYTANEYGAMDAEKQLKKLNSIRQQLRAVRVVKITSSMTVQ